MNAEPTNSPSPSGWLETHLGEVCDPPQYGFTTKADASGQGLRFLRTTDITKDPFDWSSVPFCHEQPSDPGKYRLADGDIVVSRAGSIGVSHLVRNPPEAVFASYLIRFRPLSGVQSDFVGYYLQSRRYWRAIHVSASGIALQNVNAKKLARVPFPLSPLPEQHRIVEAIEAHFSRLDAAVAALKRVQANLKRYRASVLKAACEGRLVPTEAELARKEGRDYEPASKLLVHILEERREKWEGRRRFKEAARPEKGLPEVSEGWVWATIEQLAAPGQNSITDGPFGSNLKTAHYTDQGPRVIRLQNVGDGEFVDERAHISHERFEQLAKHQIHGGDLVLATLGTDLPRACQIPEGIGKAIVKADCIRFKPALAGTAAVYLLRALIAHPTRQRTKHRIHGVGRPRLKLGEIKSIAVPIPPLSEMTRIVYEQDRLLAVVSSVEAAVAANLKRAERLRQAILKRAFEGRLVPTEHELAQAEGRTFESAEQLLARIKASQPEPKKTTRKPRKKPAKKKANANLFEEQQH